MPENTTLFIIGACVVVLLGLFYYYLNRQVQAVQSTNQSLMNHIMFQQKIIEKHDQMLSQTLGVPRSSMEDYSIPSAAVRFEAPPPPAPSPVNPDLGPVASLGPMVGTLLNMMHHIKPPSGNGGDESEADDEALGEEPISQEDIQKELYKELEELKPMADIPLKKKEGRVEEEEEDVIAE
jgi:hypothetical protein